MKVQARRGKRSERLDDDTALRAAYAAHGPELYRFALRALRDTGAAEEVVQETFMRAWRSSDRFDPALASLRVWLFAIARNLTSDHARSRAVRPWERVGSDDTEPPDARAGDDLDHVLSCWVVEEGLRRIRDDHRHVIVETYLRGRPAAEVAHELGVPAGTIRSRLFYGLKALRVAMDELGVSE